MHKCDSNLWLVVVRPFAPANDDSESAAATCSRAQRIADRVLALDLAAAAEELNAAVASLSEHHRDVDSVFLWRFHEINGLSIAATSVSDDQAPLIGGHPPDGCGDLKVGRSREFRISERHPQSSA